MDNKIVYHVDPTGACFCNECRGRQLQVLQNSDADVLIRMYKNILPVQVETCLIRLYKRTLHSIVVAKACKSKILRNSRYKYLKSHFKKIEHCSDEEAGKLADSLNEGCRVFDNWERIVLNLMQFKTIDSRTLSVKQLYRAQDMTWCLQYEENLRKRSSKPDTPIYSEKKFQSIIQFIKDTGIIEDVDNDSKVITGICSRLQRELLKHRR